MIFQAPIHSNPQPIDFESSEEEIEDLPILEKLSIFKNIVANREHKNLISKTQIHPLHDEIIHEERNTRKKDKAVIEEKIVKDTEDVVNDKMDIVKDRPEAIKDNVAVKDRMGVVKPKFVEENVHENLLDVPKFKPILPNFGRNVDMDLTYGYDGKINLIIKIRAVYYRAKLIVSPIDIS